MIKFGKWVQTGSGNPLAAIRVTHYLTREELADTLAANMFPDVDDLPELSAKQAEEAIRDQLMTNAQNAGYWTDNYTDSESEIVRAWAARQVEKMLRQ